MKALIAELQKEMEATRMEIRRLTGLNDNDLNDMLIDGAHEWLLLITAGNATAVDHMQRLREFWGFWKKTWHKADLAFIEFMKQWAAESGALNYYRQYHRVTMDNELINNPNIQAEYYLVRKLSGRKL